jgi:hypothetical protein
MSQINSSSERRGSLLTGILAVVVFLTLHPAVLEHFSTHFIGGAAGDAGLYVWLTKSFFNDPWQALSFETNTLYPYPITRAWSDPFFIPAAASLLFSSIGLSLTQSYNTIILLAFSSNAVACSLLARRVGVLPALATAVGVLFANSSYILGNLGHPQLLFFFWIPLAWLAVLPPSVTTRAPARNWFIAGLCVAAAFYTAVYYAIFAALGLGVIWFHGLFYGRFSSRRTLRTLLFAVLGAAPIFYGMQYYLSIQKLFGERGFHEAAHFAATGLSYLSFTGLHRFYSFSSALSHSEAYLSPGYFVSLIALITILSACWKRSSVLALPVILAAASLLVASSIVDQSNYSENILCISGWVILIGALAYTSRDRSALACFTLIAVLFWVFSFGPGGNPTKGEPVFSPLGLLYHRIPGLAAVRAVGRYGSVVVLASFIVAALGVQRLILKRLTNFSPVLAALIFLVLGCLDNLVTTIPLDPPTPAAQAFLALKDGADSDNVQKVALVLPFAPDTQRSAKNDSWSAIAVLNSSYSIWESALNAPNLKLVNGYSGQRSKIQLQLPKATKDFPDRLSLDYFARICGLNRIVVAPTLYNNWNEANFNQKLVDNTAAFTATQHFDDGSYLISLSRREMELRDGESLILFAPRESPTAIEVSHVSNDDCIVTATSLGKSSGDSRIELQRSEFAVKGSQKIVMSPPGSLSKASPHLIEIKFKGCSGKFSCS